MTSTVPKSIAAAPPDDPVKEALENPEIRAKLLSRSFTALGNHADAQEAVQETLARAWAKRALYKPDCGSVSGWLYGFAANVFKEKYRDKKKHTGKVDVDWLQARPDNRVDQADIRFVVERHMTKLKGNYQAVIRMRHFEDADDAEIAKRLQTTCVNVRQLARRALVQLREFAMKEGRP